jgi:hypothetical protein
VLSAGDGIKGADNWRYRTLRPAVTARDPAAHLGALFGISDEDFRAETDAGTDGTKDLLHRAMARAVCQSLDARGQLWPMYRGWRDDFATDPDGVAAFTRINSSGNCGGLSSPGPPLQNSHVR